jgi:hypothetical protein
MKDDDRFLYRGTTEYRDLIGPVFPKKDRMPMSSPVARHNIMDAWFLKHFGFKYRSGGVFAHVKWELAKSYGMPFIIFPEDGYKLCTSPIIHDLYDEFEEPDDLVHAGYFKNDMSSYSGFEELKDFKRNVDSKFDETEIENVLHFGKYYEFKNIGTLDKTFGNEIMVKCDSFYGIHVPGDMHTRTDLFQKLLYELV